MVSIRKLKKQQKALYRTIKYVFCPALKRKVYFTSEGFNHLIYESNRKPRKISEQFLKLHCLPDAPRVIAACTVISGIRSLQRKIKGTYKTATRYQLVHEVRRGISMRVIVERIGTGKYRFLSVMPHDKKSKIKNLRNKKVLVSRRKIYLR